MLPACLACFPHPQPCASCFFSLGPHFAGNHASMPLSLFFCLFLVHLASYALFLQHLLDSRSLSASHMSDPELGVGVQQGIREELIQPYHCPQTHSSLWLSFKHHFFLEASHDGFSPCPGKGSHYLRILVTSTTTNQLMLFAPDPGASSVFPTCQRAAPPAKCIKRSLGATLDPSLSLLYHLQSPAVLSLLPPKLLSYLPFSPSPSPSS